MARSDQYVLSIDLGTSGCKVGLVSITGEVVAWAFRPVPLLVVDTIGAEQDPFQWWTAFIEASREVLGQTTVQRAHIVAVCLSN